MKAPPFVYNPPETNPLPIVYEDEAVLVADKPAGLLSVPGRLEEHRDSLSLRLEAYCAGIRVVHRLDMATSGLMVFAKTADHHRTLSKAFEAREVEKAYVAKVFGSPEAESGDVRLPLITDWPNRPRQKVDHEIGKPSHTRWQVLERAGGFSLVRLIPVTGRSHQLRVHMAEISHPILGDQFYGNGESEHMAARLCLHACELGFRHPVSGQAKKFNSKADFL